MVATHETLLIKQDVYQLLMNVPAMIAVLTGPDHIFETANGLYLQAIGKERAEIIGKPVRQALPELAGQGIYELLDSVYVAGAPYTNNELKVMLDLQGDGRLQERYFKFIYQPIRGEQRAVEGIFVHAADITEHVMARKKLERSEEQLRSFVMSSPTPTGIYIGREMRIQMANEAILKTWDKNADVIGKTFREALPELEGQPFYQLLDDVYTTGVTYQATEDRVDLFRNGRMETTYYNFSYKALRNERGEIYGVINNGVEVTELVLAKNKIREAEQVLEKQVLLRTQELEKLNTDLLNTNEQLKQFAYVASHDLQEPLRKINMFSDKLIHSNEANQSLVGREYLDKIMRAAKRMSTLINDLLNFSKLETRDSGFQRVNLNEVAEKIREDYEILIAQKQAVIRIDPLCIIEAVPLQMNQLVYNLVGNALKFTKENTPPVITIQSRFLSKEEVQGFHSLNAAWPYCEIVFQDNGIGFDQQFAEKIFEIFQRLHGKLQYEGTGIGLALCKKIADHHQGEIYAMSQEGEGASFHIILPVSRG